MRSFPQKLGMPRSSRRSLSSQTMSDDFFSKEIVQMSVAQITSELTSQSANFVVAGFSFGAAIAWMDFVRYVIAQVVSVPKNGGSYYLLSAVFTTLLAIVVFLIMHRVLGVQKPAQPIFAVTAR